jgi:hypothetical protein
LIIQIRGSNDIFGTSTDVVGKIIIFLQYCMGVRLFSFLLIGIVGGGVLLVPLGTEVTNRPTVPVPGGYDDGEIGGMIGRGNRSTRRKPAPIPLCP